MTTLMRRETDEIPECVRAQERDGADAFAQAGEALRVRDPGLLVTVARGSSDHAAAYLKALVELRMGVPVASLSPSVASIYGTRLRLEGAASVAISQSGRSPDLIAALAMTRDGGAAAHAILNAPDAPLGRDARVLPIAAGEECAVAATKSFTGALAAAARLVAAWSEDNALAVGLATLPDALAHALDADWDAAIAPLTDASSVYVIGRGPMLGVAMEAALKLKETCELHAEGYSAAEVLHGPLQLAAGDLTALVLATDDAARPSIDEAVRRLSETGTRVLVADTAHGPSRVPADETASTGGTPIGAGLPGVTHLPVAPTGHALLDPLSLATSFYGLAERLARARGLDPDAPSLLAKVTRTR